jgi:xyloglucan:xyloglucosyl transferase
MARRAAAAAVPALLLVLALAAASGADAQPSPGYYPSSRFRPIPFNRGYSNKWGPQHQTLSGDHSSLTIWLDRTCGMCLYYTVAV